MTLALPKAYDLTGRTALVTGAGGLSAAPSEAEGRLAWSWARSIWADALG